MLLQETYFKHNDVGGLQVKEWMQLYHANMNLIRAEGTVLILD